MDIRLATFNDQSAVISMANEVYYSSEREFWKEGYYRINEKEYTHFITEEWLYLAEIDENLVGCVLMKPVDDITTSFSMLICHPEHRKKGIGKTLVDHVFKTAYEKKYQRMQLEILSPLHWVHEEKEFLKHLDEVHHNEIIDISKNENIPVKMVEMITVSNSTVFINSN